jgi:hypothetical protein
MFWLKLKLCLRVFSSWMLNFIFFSKHLNKIFPTIPLMVGHTGGRSWMTNHSVSGAYPCTSWWQAMRQQTEKKNRGAKQRDGPNSQPGDDDARKVHGSTSANVRARTHGFPGSRIFCKPGWVLVRPHGNPNAHPLHETYGRSTWNSAKIQPCQWNSPFPAFHFWSSRSYHL